MVGGGFEPPKAEPADLQSAPFDRFGTPPEVPPTNPLKNQIPAWIHSELGKLIVTGRGFKGGLGQKNSLGPEDAEAPFSIRVTSS